MLSVFCCGQFALPVCCPIVWPIHSPQGFDKGACPSSFLCLRDSCCGVPEWSPEGSVLSIPVSQAFSFDPKPIEVIPGTVLQIGEHFGHCAFRIFIPWGILLLPPPKLMPGPLGFRGGPCFMPAQVTVEITLFYHGTRRCGFWTTPCVWPIRPDSSVV